jgi:hypothetical protein
VIENDVSSVEIADHARAAGLDEPEMLVQFRRPLRLSLKAFRTWADEGTPPSRLGNIVERLGSQLLDLQCFSITKGLPESDSREVSTLRGTLQVSQVQSEGGRQLPFCRFELQATNMGTGIWRTGTTGRPGTVNVGIQVLDGSGQVIEVDFQRIFLPQGGVRPGERTKITADVHLPPLSEGALRFDLVSEHVAWFGPAGRGSVVDVSLSHCREFVAASPSG